MRISKSNKTSVKASRGAGSTSDLQQKVIDYIMNDTVRKERFSGIEICTEADNYEANDIIQDIVSLYTSDDCKAFLAAIEDFDTDIIEGGWKDASGQFFSKSYYTKACGDVKASKRISANDQALTHIKAAIDILGKSGNKDAVTKDSIANLATVMFDIKGSTLLAAKQLSANGLSEGMTIKDIDDGQEFTVGRVEKGEKPNTFDVYDSEGSLVGTYDNAPQFERVD